VRKFRINHDRRGFTLIELVIIIVVLGIIAAVAIPKYVDMVTQAKISAAKGALGGLRSAISIYYANTALTTGTATWPPIDSVRNVGTVMIQSIPKNPYQSDSNAPDSIVTGVTKGTIVGTRGGWAYRASTGDIWPNTNSAGENNW
jgi:prepilin-type N-terminal cleavage/methylation domain-containing protein